MAWWTYAFSSAHHNWEGDQKSPPGRVTAAITAGALVVPAELASRPWLPSVAHALGLAHLKQGRPAEAIPLLEEAARLQPRRTLVQEHLRQTRQ